MKVCVVGLGYWGPNLVRNFISNEHIEGVVCCDVSEKRLEVARKRFPSVEVTTSFDDVLRRSDVEAVVLATPVSTHYALAMKALEAGKHVLVEKPMTESSEEAYRLAERAEERGLTLMVDHTFVYTGAVRKVKEIIQRGALGEVMYFDSVRVNLGLFQHDTNVIWDLAPHDLSIMDYLIGKEPIAVSADGASHFNDVEDIAYLTVRYSNQLIAHFHVNWLSPVKVRRILIGGSKLMVVYDDMEPSEKVKVYDKGVDIKGRESIYRTLVQYRTGDMYAPRIDLTEALTLVVEEFLDSINMKKRPLTDGLTGARIVRILEAASLSLREQGRLVEITPRSVFERAQS
jgi:predicted dehydrogenase